MGTGKARGTLGLGRHGKWKTHHGQMSWGTATAGPSGTRDRLGQQEPTRAWKATGPEAGGRKAAIVSGDNLLLKAASEPPPTCLHDGLGEPGGMGRKGQERPFHLFSSLDV